MTKNTTGRCSTPPDPAMHISIHLLVHLHVYAGRDDRLSECSATRVFTSVMSCVREKLRAVMSKVVDHAIMVRELYVLLIDGACVVRITSHMVLL
jgi:hypothetical protein